MKIRRPRSTQPIPSHAIKKFDGEIFNVYQWEQEMFDGSTAIFEKVMRTDTVNIIPVTEDGKIILSEERQPGTDPFIALTGGRIDAGEEALEAAKRELLEETGHEASEWVLWNSYQPAGSKIDWAVYNFVAKGCKKVAEMDLDGGEEITLRYVDFEDFWVSMLDERFRSQDVELLLLRMKERAGELDEFKRLLFS